ncbi:MAG: phosphoribosyltransferase [Chitinophagales bacterium]|nr:phosphoribosyltransferase [Chitinophagales bacterium]
MSKKIAILSAEDIRQKTTRIAYQILEENFAEKKIVMIGIKDNGLVYAKQLIAAIDKIEKLDIELLSLSIDKSKPLSQPVTLNNQSTLNGKVVILVDDVANTGKTMFYALQPLLQYSPKKVQAVVLVDRQHKLFPVTPDFIGLSLSTTLKERIEVQFDKKGNGTAYLV